jgi:hypothetical protein
VFAFVLLLVLENSENRGQGGEHGRFQKVASPHLRRGANLLSSSTDGKIVANPRGTGKMTP